MNHYSYCERLLRSNIRIPELYEIFLENKTPLSFVLEKSVEKLIYPDWKHSWPANGTPHLHYGQQDSIHILHFPKLADFKISPDSNSIHCFPRLNIPEQTIRHLLLDQVLPRCLAHQGHMILHASAVLVEKGLILFVGPSGAGKSTIAGYFHRSGHPAVSDDCMFLAETKNHVTAIPCYGGMRLWEDSREFLFPDARDTFEMAHYSSKQRIALTDQDDKKPKNNRIAAIIFLSPTIEYQQEKPVQLNPVPLRAGYMELLKQTYQLDVTDLESLVRHAKGLGNVIQKIPLFQLSMPHDYTLLQTARNLIIDKIASNE